MFFKAMANKTIDLIKKFIVNVIDFFVDSVSDYDERTGEEKFSLGRGSWIVWFYSTIYFVFNGIILSYIWYLVGLSLLGYIIGSKYIVTSIGGASRIENVDWSNEEHP